jgi:hypothetical protein
VGDTSEIVIVTGHPVCKMDPPMAGGGLQLVCINILGAGKVFMKVIYWASAPTYMVNKTDRSIDTLCAWKLYRVIKNLCAPVICIVIITCTETV